MKKLSMLTGALTILLLLSVGCQSPLAYKKSSVGAVAVNLSVSPRTILPPSTITSYSVSGAGPNGATLPAMAQTGSSFTLEDLEAGSWDLVVNGLDADGSAVASGSANVTITAAETASASITLGHLAGTGTFTLAVSWTGSSSSGFSGTLASLTGTIAPLSGDALPFTATFSGSSATYTNSTLASGSYLVTLTALDSVGKTMVFSEALQIFKGLTSTRTLDQADLVKYFWAPPTVTSGALPMDLAHWTKDPSKTISPAVSVIADGFLLPGGIHVNPGPPSDGSGLDYNTPLDLRNKVVSTKFKAQTSAYLVVASGPLDSKTRTGLGGYFKLTNGLGMNSTHHAFLSTTLIPSDTWIYEEWEFSATRGWGWKTATGNYPSLGGTLITSQSGSISTEDFSSLSHAVWNFGFGDNYGGTADSVILSEVKISDSPAPNLVSNPGFENGMAGYSLEPYGSASTATFIVDSTVSHTGANSLKITNDNPEGPEVYKGFITTVSGLTANQSYDVSFWVKSQSAASNQTLHGIMDGALGQPWSQRINADAGAYDWTKFSGTYTPSSTSMTLRIDTGAVGVVWLDDLSVSLTSSANVAVSAITVAPTTLNLTAGGATANLTASVAPTTATNKSVTWSSSNPAVATVEAGVVTPVSAGSATITATTVDGPFTATCDVTVAAASLYSGMIARYTFDDGTAQDSGGNGYNGTNNGAKAVTDRHGVVGQAMGFNGTSAYLKAHLGGERPTSYTVSFWYKPTGTGTGGIPRMLELGTNDPLESGAIAQNKGLIVEYSGNPQSVWYTAMWDRDAAIVGKLSPQQPAVQNQWQLITFVYSASAGTTYVNGVSKASDPYTYGTTVLFDDVALGGEPWFGRYFNGSLDEVGIWPRALSASEVASLYAAEKPASPTIAAAKVLKLTAGTLDKTHGLSFVYTEVEVIQNGTAKTLSDVGATWSGSWNGSGNPSDGSFLSDSSNYLFGSTDPLVLTFESPQSGISGLRVGIGGFSSLGTDAMEWTPDSLELSYSTDGTTFESPTTLAFTRADFVANTAKDLLF